MGCKIVAFRPINRDERLVQSVSVLFDHGSLGRNPHRHKALPISLLCFVSMVLPQFLPEAATVRRYHGQYKKGFRPCQLAVESVDTCSGAMACRLWSGQFEANVGRGQRLEGVVQKRMRM